MHASLTELGLTSPVALAPMAGITDLPFRNVVQRFGAGLVVSEMVASQEMVKAKASTRTRAELGAGQVGTSVQIAGREAHWMAEAAKLVVGEGATRVDINMGCPAKKVTSGYSGAALMRDLDLASSLIEAVVGAVEVPVTLKMRLGWDETELSAVALAQRAEGLGVRMLTVHGRTRCQFYKGHADWVAIRPVVEAVSIPVLANGDIVDARTAQQALRDSGAAGVMVGRGAQGQPWVLAQIEAALGYGTPPVIPQGDALANLIEGHYAAMLAFYGDLIGHRVARKHLGWYMDRLNTAAPLRKSVLTGTPQEVARLIRLFCQEEKMGAEAA